MIESAKFHMTGTGTNAIRIYKKKYGKRRETKRNTVRAERNPLPLRESGKTSWSVCQLRFFSY